MDNGGWAHKHQHVYGESDEHEGGHKVAPYVNTLIMQHE